MAKWAKKQTEADVFSTNWLEVLVRISSPPLVEKAFDEIEEIRNNYPEAMFYFFSKNIQNKNIEECYRIETIKLLDRKFIWSLEDILPILTESFDNSEAICEAVKKTFFNLLSPTDLSLFLIPYLKSAKKKIRAQITKLLGSLKANREKIEPTLYKTFKDSSKEVRKNVIEALDKLETKTPKTLAIFSQGLQDPTREVCLASLTVIQKIDLTENDFTADILPLLKSSEQSVREKANQTLKLIKG